MLTAIQNRRSIRSYHSDDVATETILEILTAAVYAPTSKHNRSVEFILIRDVKTKNSLYKFLGQAFLKQAPVLVVPVIDTSKSTHPIQDLSVASENIFIQATEMHLGTIWKNVSEEKVGIIKTILGIPKGITLINIIPVGFPRIPRRPHQPVELTNKKIHNEKW